MDDMIKADTVDTDQLTKAIGARIRLARNLSGQQQGAVGKKVGCSYQQIQKYESGYNRVTADRLFLIARATNQPPAFFFEDLRTEEDRLNEAEGLRGPVIMEFVDLLAQLDTDGRKNVLGIMKGMVKK